MREKTTAAPAVAATRKAPAGLGGLEDVFAGKDVSVAELAGTPAASRPAAPAGSAVPAPGRPAAEPGAGEEDREPLITTLRIPGYLAENIRRWLYENPAHSQHSMFFAGLARLGIEVRDEDLEPRRRPRSSRHR